MCQRAHVTKFDKKLKKKLYIIIQTSSFLTGFWLTALEVTAEVHTERTDNKKKKTTGILTSQYFESHRLSLTYYYYYFFIIKKY